MVKFGLVNPNDKVMASDHSEKFSRLGYEHQPGALEAIEKQRAANREAGSEPDGTSAPAKTVQEMRAFLLSGISEGRFGTEGRIPTERELSSRFGIGRYGVRKVLQSLSSEGKISRAVGRGTFAVSESKQTESLPGIVPDHFSPAEIVQARLALEPGLADLVAINATRNDYDEMDRCLEVAAACSAEREFKMAIYRLHSTIAKATKNVLLSKIFDLIIAAHEDQGWDTVRGTLCATAQGRAKYLEENRRIIKALKARDALRAKELLYAHLVRIHSTLVGGSNPRRFGTLS